MADSEVQDSVQIVTGNPFFGNTLITRPILGTGGNRDYDLDDA
jgi:hypothetical protein